MGKMIKTYLAFTSAGYRIWALCIFPVLLLVSFWAAGTLELGGAWAAFEIFADYWLFSGICEKETIYMEYVKTSFNGKNRIRQGIAADLLRRFLYLLVLAAVVYFRSKSVWVFAQVLLVYLVSIAALNITRLWSGAWIQYTMAAVALLVYSLLYMVLFHGPVSVVTAVFAVFAVFASIGTVWHTTIRMKGSYYEKGCDKSI